MKTCKIKICGLKRPEDIAYVNEARPDFAGFIINFPKSHRSLTPDRVRELVKRLDPAIRAVGVFVDEDPEVITGLLQEGTLAMAQLHGQETENVIRQIQRESKKPVIKAFTVAGKADINRALSSPADYILLDRGQGSGQCFDWNLLPKIDRPWFLAGGLGVDNLSEAVEHISPYAVDLSSGVEIDTYKDRELILKAVKLVRNEG